MGYRNALGSAELHFWLNRSVARAVDVNLSEAMAEGTLTEQGYAAMVTRCRQCQQVEACQAWLAAGCTHDTPPEFCLNGQEISHLKN